MVDRARVQCLGVEAFAESEHLTTLEGDSGAKRVAIPKCAKGQCLDPRVGALFCSTWTRGGCTRYTIQLRKNLAAKRAGRHAAGI